LTKRLLHFFIELYDSRNVLYQLTAQQLILRYRRTMLGYLWTLINPLLMMSTMAIVFSTLFNAELKAFAVFLFAGMIPWNFFSSVATQSGAAYINNEGLIKKIYLPKAIFPLSIAFALLIDSILSFVALFLIIVALGGTFSWALLFLPVSFMLLFIFSVGFGLILSIATVFFRDLQHVILIVMQGVFFLTPIIYKQDALVGGVAWLVGLNPIIPFLALFRVPLIEAALPSGEIIFQAFMIAVVAIILGLYVFLRQEKQIIFRL
jgi:ABC-type polysaccharide/polyol phosphate export permease